MARLLRMPEVAANAVEAVLADWPIPENIPFKARDAIATVETEKAVVDVPADADGVILRTLVPAGARVEVGAPIALLGEPGEPAEDLDALLAGLGFGPEALSTPVPSTPVPTIPVPSTPATSKAVTSKPGSSTANTLSPVAPTPVASDGARGVRVFSSPLARRLARESGLSIADLRGTGPGGRVVRRDVEQAVRISGVSATASARHEDVPHTRMRRAIAARLTQSVHDAPHFFLGGTARVDRLLKLRARLNSPGIGLGEVRVSVNDLVVKAAARAHVLVPSMNVIWTPDAVRSFSAVDISLAVATDLGLVTPVLRGVDRMTVSALAATSRDLVSRARSGQLRQEELEGGALTVTNLGMFGTEEFAAIINPPQSAILAVGAALKKPVVTRGKLRVGTVMRFTLSIDHRPIDGATAAQWMAAFVSLLEDPVSLLL